MGRLSVDRIGNALPLQAAVFAGLLIQAARNWNLGSECQSLGQTRRGYGIIMAVSA